MKALLIACLLLISLPAAAGETVWVHEVDRPVEQIYKDVYKGLEEEGLYVVFEPNIGKNLAGFSKRWGEDYNRNDLSEIRSMIFCNGWYANQVSNADPDMLALCPLHITLVEKNGKSKVLFVRPSYVAKGTPAESTAVELENKVIKAVTKATTPGNKQ
jgi:uncharacterized protein (DUF302 family)